MFMTVSKTAALNSAAQAVGRLVKCGTRGQHIVDEEHRPAREIGTRSGAKGAAEAFRDLLQRQHPDRSFNWKKIRRAAGNPLPSYSGS